MKRMILSVLMLTLGACDREPPGASAGPAASQPAAAPSGGAAWLLTGANDERFARVAKHLRGFDVAMAETAYRYSELYWAGRDRNWDYADYQIGKIETAVANGVERRPRRAASARMLDGAVAPVRSAIAQRDAAAFDSAFTTLTATCNACHQAERVPFIRVQPPTVRASVVNAGADASP